MHLCPTKSGTYVSREEKCKLAPITGLKVSSSSMMKPLLNQSRRESTLSHPLDRCEETNTTLCTHCTACLHKSSMFIFGFGMVGSPICNILIYLSHRSVQSQLQTKNFQDIWHMPNYSLIFQYLKQEKTKKSSEDPFREDRLKYFPYKSSRERKARVTISQQKLRPVSCLKFSKCGLQIQIHFISWNQVEIRLKLWV